MQDDRIILGKIEFVAVQILGMLVTSEIYINSPLFHTVSKYSVKESKIILLIIVMGVIILSSMIQMKQCRDVMSVATNLVNGFGLFTVITTKQSSCLIIIVLLFIISTILIYAIVSWLSGKVPIIQWLKCFATAGLSLTALGMLFLMCFLFFDIHTLSIDTMVYKQDGEIPVLSQLNEEVWAEASEEERLEFLEAVVYQERIYLGITHEISLQPAYLENMLAYYNDRRREIVINMDSVLNDTAENNIRHILHEVYHCYEHNIVSAWLESPEEYKNLRIFQYASLYQNEFKDYKTGENGQYSDYYNQLAEKHARAYEDYRIDEYHDESE